MGGVQQTNYKNAVIFKGDQLSSVLLVVALMYQLVVERRLKLN